MSINEDLGRYLSFQLEKTFPLQLGKLSMTELNNDPDNRATLNKLLDEISNEYGTPINELKRKVSFKLYKSKASNSTNANTSSTISSNQSIIKPASESSMISRSSQPVKPISYITSEGKKRIQNNIRLSLQNKLKNKKKKN